MHSLVFAEDCFLIKWLQWHCWLSRQVLFEDFLPHSQTLVHWHHMETAGTSNLYCVGTWQYDSLDVRTEEVYPQGKANRWAYSVDNIAEELFSWRNVSSFSAKYYTGYTHACTHWRMHTHTQYGVFRQYKSLKIINDAFFCLYKAQYWYNYYYSMIKNTNKKEWKNFPNALNYNFNSWLNNIFSMNVSITHHCECGGPLRYNW